MYVTPFFGNQAKRSQFGCPLFVHLFFCSCLVCLFVCFFSKAKKGEAEALFAKECLLGNDYHMNIKTLTEPEIDGILF